MDTSRGGRANGRRRWRLSASSFAVWRLGSLYVTAAWRVGYGAKHKIAFTWAGPLRFDYPQEIQSAGHLTSHDTSKSSDEPSCLRRARLCAARHAATACRCMPPRGLREDSPSISSSHHLQQPCMACFSAHLLPSSVRPSIHPSSTVHLHPVSLMDPVMSLRQQHGFQTIASLSLCSSPDSAAPRGTP